MRKFFWVFTLLLLSISTANASDQNATAQKSVTIYVHGFHEKGDKLTGVYGDIDTETITENILEFIGYPTLETYDPDNFENIITTTDYYGDTAPDYYSEQDILDIEATNIYGGGVPRYALIVAKFAKHMLEVTGADNINIVSGSMGSLVTRWMIEKNLENLAGNKKIGKWLSINGVIRGNYPASQTDLVAFVRKVTPLSIDVRHMGYQWIERQLSSKKSIGDSPYYQAIQIGQISSTVAGFPFGTLMKNLPNDGYQKLSDTYFEKLTSQSKYLNLDPTHSIFHQGHISIKEYDGAWANIATFLSSKTRVRVTMHQTKVYNIHEKRMPFQNKTRAEIVFASEVYSDAINEKWGISDAISQRTLTGGSLPVHKYKRKRQTKNLNQVIYDDFVVDEEQYLNVIIKGYELDDAIKYGVNERLFLGGNDSLGSTQVTLPLKNAAHTIYAKDWKATLKVEVIHYP